MTSKDLPRIRVVKIIEVVVEMATTLSQGVDKADIEKLVEVIPEELTEELLELKWEHIAEEEVR